MSSNFFGNFDLTKPLLKKRQPDFLANDDEDIFDLQPNSNTKDIEAKPGKYSNDEYATTATDEYLTHLHERPKRADNPSSTGRKIGGIALAALTGSDFGVTNAPYHNALRDWSESGSGLKEGALIEQKGNVELRRRLKDAVVQARNTREYQRKVAEAHKRFEMANEKLGIVKDENVRRQLQADKRNELTQQLIDLRREHMQNVSIPMRNIAQQNADTRAAGLDERSNRPVPATEQKAIRGEARRLVAADPRFSEFFVPEKGAFADQVYKLDAQGQPVLAHGEPIILKTMDPATKQMLQRSIVEAESKIANKRRKQYDVDAMSDQDINDYLKDFNFGDEENDALGPP